MTEKENKKIIFLCLLGILAVAVFFRLWQLDSIPPGLYPDVAINGNDALNTLETGDFKVFYPENNGREGLFIWMIALSFAVFGASVWSIKIVAAIGGILTVPGLYLLTKELFRVSNFNLQVSKNIALLSAFFLATSFWHINFSRVGFRAILIPLVFTFAFYFLFRGIREKSVFDFIISGIIFGSGFYTYIAYRFVVLLIPAVLLFGWRIYEKERLRKQFLLSVLWFTVSAFIIASPVAIYFSEHPRDFFGRAAGVSVFGQENPVEELGKSLILHLGMFNFYGDQNWRHNYPPSPMLPWTVGSLFLIGFFHSIKKILGKSNERNKNRQPRFTFYFLLSAFFIMLLPGVLSYEGIPHSLRTIGAIPIVYIFAGFGGCRIYEYLKEKTGNGKLLLACCFLFLVFAGSGEFYKYFYLWGKNPETKGAFSEDYVKIGDYLNSLPETIRKYAIVNRGGVAVPYPDGLPMPAQTPIFIEKTKFSSLRAIYLLPEDLDEIKTNETPAVIVPLGQDEKLFGELREKFPGGELKEENGIWIYKIY